MEKDKIVVGLDIGTTKICAIVGRKNEYGKLEVLGMGKAVSDGVIRGIVSNIDKTIFAIEKAIEEACRVAKDAVILCVLNRYSPLNMARRFPGHIRCFCLCRMSAKQSAHCWWLVETAAYRPSSFPRGILPHHQLGSGMIAIPCSSPDR